MIARCKLQYFLLIALISIVLSSAHATPVVIEFFKGGGSSITDINPLAREGLNDLNTLIRNQFVGHDFYTRVFEASQTDEAINFTNSFGADAKIFLIGHSLGGAAAIDIAEHFSGGLLHPFTPTREIERLITLDPFGCFLGCTDTVIWNYLHGTSSTTGIINSFPSLSIPSNVNNATNYYQITTAR